MAADDHGPVMPTQAVALLALHAIVGFLLGVYGTWPTVALVSATEAALLVGANFSRETLRRFHGPLEDIAFPGSITFAVMWFVIVLRSGILLAMNGFPPNPWRLFFQ